MDSSVGGLLGGVRVEHRASRLETPPSEGPREVHASKRRGEGLPRPAGRRKMRRHVRIR
jgi:hypothetical protein